MTAGNSSQVSYGAAAVIVDVRRQGGRTGVRPRAQIVDQVTLGVDRVTVLIGPIPATSKILTRNGVTTDDIDVVEINEAFASVVLVWQRETQTWIV